MISKVFSACFLVVALTLPSGQVCASSLIFPDDFRGEFSIGEGETVVFGRDDITGPSTDYYRFTLVDVTNTITTSFRLNEIASGGFTLGIFSDPLETLNPVDWTELGSINGTDVLTLSGLDLNTPYYMAVSWTTVFGKPAGYAARIKAVPLPTAAVLFGSALLGFAGFATRRRIS